MRGTLTAGNTKHCSHCGQTKPLFEFRPSNHADGRVTYGRCRTCQRNYDALRRGAFKAPLQYDQYRVPTIHSYKKHEILGHKVDVISYARTKGRDLPVLEHTCKECSKQFTPLHKLRKVFCSIKCCERYGRRLRKAREKVRLKHARREDVRPTLVFKKANWHCQQCGVHTPRSLRGTIEDNAPELDHIIPLAKGGEHSYANTQLLCRRCNYNKRDLIVTQL